MPVTLVPSKCVHSILLTFLQLVQYRSEQPYFKGTSFSTISAFGTNAAIVHYSPTVETDALITTESVYLGKVDIFYLLSLSLFCHREHS